MNSNFVTSKPGTKPPGLARVCGPCPTGRSFKKIIIIIREREETNLPCRGIPHKLCRYSTLMERNLYAVRAAYNDFLPKNRI